MRVVALQRAETNQSTTKTMRAETRIDRIDDLIDSWLPCSALDRLPACRAADRPERTCYVNPTTSSGWGTSLTRVLLYFYKMLFFLDS